MPTARIWRSKFRPVLQSGHAAIPSRACQHPPWPTEPSWSHHARRWCSRLNHHHHGGRASERRAARVEASRRTQHAEVLSRQHDTEEARAEFESSLDELQAACLIMGPQVYQRAVLYSRVRMYRFGYRKMPRTRFGPASSLRRVLRTRVCRGPAISGRPAAISSAGGLLPVHHGMSRFAHVALRCLSARI